MALGGFQLYAVASATSPALLNSWGTVPPANEQVAYVTLYNIGSGAFSRVPSLRYYANSNRVGHG